MNDLLSHVPVNLPTTESDSKHVTETDAAQALLQLHCPMYTHASTSLTSLASQLSVSSISSSPSLSTASFASSTGPTGPNPTPSLNCSSPQTRLPPFSQLIFSPDEYHPAELYPSIHHPAASYEQLPTAQDHTAYFHSDRYIAEPHVKEPCAPEFRRTITRKKAMRFMDMAFKQGQTETHMAETPRSVRRMATMTLGRKSWRNHETGKSFGNTSKKRGKKEEAPPVSGSDGYSSSTERLLCKPRWQDAERLELLEAIVQDKQLNNMATFRWDRISMAVGRAKKACKDQWRREVLPALMNSLKAPTVIITKSSTDNDSK
ncbi:uncharacterized protein BYT42DRAFT_571345 [Radiomyces spectabilis]|uniref:uncharacterized protein n=1 Tax=Radiomyces spectabilis TaxID=64574 RepID=UPI0022207AE3|nr:uncharacterized protein BYT42DRAFT_571345 [Radiomyces spectabilis]KAI8377716.1 hypothetical protein BYT42DRAFT_571345 [Radiomyces spectabilis]